MVPAQNGRPGNLVKLADRPSGWDKFRCSLKFVAYALALYVQGYIDNLASLAALQHVVVYAAGDVVSRVSSAN